MNNLNFQIVWKFNKDFTFTVEERILSARISGKEILYLIKKMFFPEFPVLEKEVQVAPAKHNPLK